MGRLSVPSHCRALVWRGADSWRQVPSCQTKLHTMDAFIIHVRACIPQGKKVCHIIEHVYTCSSLHVFIRESIERERRNYPLVGMSLWPFSFERAPRFHAKTVSRNCISNSKIWTLCYVLNNKVTIFYIVWLNIGARYSKLHKSPPNRKLMRIHNVCKAKMLKCVDAILKLSNRHKMKKKLPKKNNTKNNYQNKK